MRLRKEPDENLQQEVIEEEENDDFENLYRGQISKSGIAILPSKRTRKIPEANKAATTIEDVFNKVKEPINTEQPIKGEEPLALKEEVKE